MHRSSARRRALGATVAAVGFIVVIATAITPAVAAGARSRTAVGAASGMHAASKEAAAKKPGVTVPIGLPIPNPPRASAQPSSSATGAPARTSSPAAPTPAAPTTGAPPPMAGQTRWAHLRFTATSTSDWTTIHLSKIAQTGYRVVARSAGAVASPMTDGMLLNGGSKVASGVSVTWDIILRPADGVSSLALDVQKGDIGGVAVTVTRLDDAGTTTVATLVDASTAPTPNDVHQSLTATQIMGTVGLTWPRLTPSHLVFAAYYPWYDAPDGYSLPKMALHPTNPRDTDDAAGVASMVAQAQAAGIDGFLFSYTGDAPHRADFAVVARAEQAAGGTIAPYFETPSASAVTGGDASATAALVQQWLRAAVAQAGPTSLRWSDGRLVVFVYGMKTLSVATWQSILSTFTAQRTPLALVGDASGDPAYDTVTVGSHDYNVANLSTSALATYEDGISADAKVPAVLGTGSARMWVGTVSPGYDDRTINSPGHVVSRAGGARYEATWSAALSADPDWVMVTSWNEDYESTAIEPDMVYGTTALDQTAGWAAAFKGRR